MKLALASIALLSGCAQILGLDDTTLERRDAAADAPNVCDTPAFECVVTTGRTVCGRLFVAGTAEPFTVAEPTAQACTTTEGPCGLTVAGQSLTTLFAGSIADRMTASVDDCGHFVISGLDEAATGLAVTISGAGYVNTARAIVDFTTGTAIETGVEALVVPTATQASWAAQLSLPDTEITSGYLVRYLTAMGAPVTNEEVRVGGAGVGMPSVRPWASYFTGSFDSLDPALTASSAALIATPLAGTFRLGGFHVGKTCGRDGFQTVMDMLIYVVLKDC